MSLRPARIPRTEIAGRKTDGNSCARAPTPSASFLLLRDRRMRLPGGIASPVHLTAGLSGGEAARRLRSHGRNELRAHPALTRIRVLGRQLKSPLLLLLLFAAVVALASGEMVDAGIVLTIVTATVAIGAHREYGAEAAARALRARVRTLATVLRDGAPARIPIEDVVPGDVVLLAAGSVVPADCAVLEATDLFVSEAVLTGESFPVEKASGPGDPGAPLADRSRAVFFGTSVSSGTARCLVVATGRDTAFGEIAERLELRRPDTAFEQGLARFGYLLTIAMLVMVLVVFVAHVLRGRSPGDTLLFSIALAVGLSPELLPAILTVNLSRGAERMAVRGVLVRRLTAIENLGSMDVLCTDKTGTLTEGVVKLDGAFDHAGEPSSGLLELAAINAALETGVAGPLDDAILAARQPDLAGWTKVGEIPFDFVRKRVSVVVDGPRGRQLITKGAFQQVLDATTRLPGGQPLDVATRQRASELHRSWSERGMRVVAVAIRALTAQPSYGRADERDLELAGFLTFLDRPKEGAAQAIGDLARLGVSVKLITGDSKLVAQHVAGLVGLSAGRVLTGDQLDHLHDDALWHAAERTDLFVEVDPHQKERIIRSLRKTGHVVGFLGDGVNDAPAMHAADTSLSVDGAVDVAREAADFVLLERHLDVIRNGIEEGRRTFANTLKYLLITMSANLGNMASMAVASLFLPFLPLTAGQILLNNILSDVPAVGLAADSVDGEEVARPRRWQMRFIGRFMMEFGLLSSLFDLLTFAGLLWLFHAGPTAFRTAWFVESLLTELVVVLVMRTRRPFFASRPGRVLVASTAAVAALALALPYLPLVGILGFVPLAAPVVGGLVLVTGAYVLATELLKRWFYRPAARPR
jgi:P-type Mg2+ transporter